MRRDASGAEEEGPRRQAGGSVRSVLGRDPDKAGGARLFRGTRVPDAAPFGNLGDGAAVEQFSDRIPGVERRQAESVPDHESRDLGVPAA